MLYTKEHRKKWRIAFPTNTVDVSLIRMQKEAK